MYTKQQYIDFLTNNTCEVVFTKQNGELRTMRCTLNRQLMESKNLVPITEAIGPDNQVRCIDIDKNQWRSFLVSDVISFLVIPEVKAA